MTLKIFAEGENTKGVIFDRYKDVEISIKYNSIASTFSFTLYYDPTNPLHIKLFKPFTYLSCEVYHENVLVLTGTILNHTFKDAGNPPVQLVECNGYSITGILKDCTLYDTHDTTSINPYTGISSQTASMTSTFQNMSLLDITTTICAMFPLNVVVDSSVKDECNKIFEHKNLDWTKPIADVLDEIATQLNVVISHTPKGEILFTRAVTTTTQTTETTFIKVLEPITLRDDTHNNKIKVPKTIKTVPKTITVIKSRAVLHNFTLKADRAPDWLTMDFDCNGQSMHSNIEVIGEQSTGEFNLITGNTTPANSADTFTYNPYVNDNSNLIIQRNNSNPKFKAGLRNKRVIQTSGDDNDIELTARKVLGDELLKGIKLTVKIQGWVLGGNLVTSNQLITAINPNIHLFKTTKFLIKQVDLCGDEKSETATLTCCLPECFNNDDVISIF